MKTIPNEAICTCTVHDIFHTVVPLPDICRKCHKAILKMDEQQPDVVPTDNEIEAERIKRGYQTFQFDVGASWMRKKLTGIPGNKVVTNAHGSIEDSDAVAFAEYVLRRTLDLLQSGQFETKNCATLYKEWKEKQL